MHFPLYATQKNHSVWYKILSEKQFIEWKRLGPSNHPLPDNYLRSEIVAEDYSTYLYIADLLKSIEEGNLLKVDESELPQELDGK